MGIKFIGLAIQIENTKFNSTNVSLLTIVTSDSE